MWIHQETLCNVSVAMNFPKKFPLSHSMESLNQSPALREMQNNTGGKYIQLLPKSFIEQWLICILVPVEQLARMRIWGISPSLGGEDRKMGRRITESWPNQAQADVVPQIPDQSLCSVQDGDLGSEQAQGRSWWPLREGEKGISSLGPAPFCPRTSQRVTPRTLGVSAQTPGPADNTRGLKRAGRARRVLHKDF